MENFANVLAISAIGGIVGACVVLLAILIKHKLCKRKDIDKIKLDEKPAEVTAQDNSSEEEPKPEESKEPKPSETEEPKN